MEIIEPGHTRGNLRMLETQIRNGFEIPESLRKAAPMIVGKILRDGTKREQIAAARVLVAMERVNNPQPVQHQHLHQHGLPEQVEGETFEQRRERLRERNRRLTRAC